MNMFQSDFITPLRNLPADDPLGIEAWSHSRGLELHTGLALVTCVLSGVAGPMRSFRVPTPGSVGVGCNLIAMEGDGLVSMAASELIEPLCQTQKSLVAKGREFTTKELTDAMYDPGMRLRNSDHLDELRNYNADGSSLSDFGAEGRLDRDAQITPRSVVFDGLARPRFILTGACRGDLAKVLAGCHGGMGFAAWVESLPPKTGDRNRRINELLDGFRGMTADRPSMGVQTINSSETVQLAGLLRFPENDFRWIIRNRKDLLAAALPISSIRSGNCVDETVDEDRADGFLSLYHRVARNAHASRRAHHWLDKNFSDFQAIDEFTRHQRAFTRTVHQSGDGQCVHSAASMPAQMAWTLLLLAGRNNLDEYIIRTVFDAARHLHAETLSLFTEEDRSMRAQRLLKVAKKLVARVISVGPCTRRNLVRCLDKQSLHLHEPVISVMIDHGIFIEKPDGLLELGRVPIKSLAATMLIDINPLP